MKADPATAAIPVLNLSATFTLTRHRVQGLDSGADAYLCHPVEPIELVATVNALLRVRRAEQALRDAADPPVRRAREIVDRQVTHMSRLLDAL